MFVVADESELNWWFRRFAPRISLRLSPDFVEIASTQGVAQSSAVLTVIRDGDRTFVCGVGDDPVANVSADRIPVFQVPGEAGLSPVDAVERLLCALLKRLPPSGSLIRPVVIVEGLHSLEDVLRGQRCEIVTRALAASGAVAAVIPSGQRIGSPVDKRI
jgi:hypothetical protein